MGFDEIGPVGGSHEAPEALLADVVPSPAVVAGCQQRQWPLAPQHQSPTLYCFAGRTRAATAEGMGSEQLWSTPLVRTREDQQRRRPAHPMEATRSPAAMLCPLRSFVSTRRLCNNRWCQLRTQL